MPISAKELIESLKRRFADDRFNYQLQCNQATLTLPAEELLPVCKILLDDSHFLFHQLIDLCGIDYIAYKQTDWETQNTTATGFSRGRNPTGYSDQHMKSRRFAVIYHLSSLEHNMRLRLRCFTLGEPPTIDSVVSIWSSANWYEREAFDMFGILFNGHPDLRRILTDYGFIGHPFRKDFPLEGHVETRYDPDKKRVIYQPVSIQNRVLVPRVIRQDNRYHTNEGTKNA